METEKKLKASAVLSYLSMFSSIVTGIIFTSFMSKMLPQEELGLFNTLGNFVGTMSIFNFGLLNTVIRYVSKYKVTGEKEKQENFLGMCMVFYTIIAAVTLIVGLIGYTSFSQLFSTISYEYQVKGKKIFGLLVINIAVSLGTQVFPGIMSAYQQFTTVRTLEIIKSIVRPFIGYALLSTREDVFSIVVMDTSLNFIYIACIILWCVFKLKIKIKFKNIDFSSFKTLFSYSIFVFIGSIVDQLYWNVDTFILTRVNGDAGMSQSAITGNANRLISYYIKFSTAISGLFLPRVTKMITQKATNKQLTDLMIRIGRVQLYVMSLILIGFTVIGQQFVSLWTKPEFANIYPIVIMLMIPLLIPEVQTIGLTILYAKKKHKFRSICYLAIAILNVIVSIPLAKRYGEIGVAIGTALGIVLGQCITMNIYYKRVIGIEIGRFFKETFSRILPCAIATLAIGSLTFLIPQNNDIFILNGWGLLLLRGVIVVVVFAILQYTFAMNEYEKGIVKTLFKALNRLKKPFRKGE